MSAAVEIVARDAEAVGEQLAQIDWGRVSQDLDTRGNGVIEGLLSPEQCRTLAGRYQAKTGFRSRVVMARHGFGRGEYQYFSYPLPPLLAALRTLLYPYLAPIANRWNQALGNEVRFPAEHREFIARCHEAGQRNPTPLLLQYDADDYNCLHQDVYGEHVFPLQVAVLLSQPGADFSGGEFVLTPLSSPCASGRYREAAGSIGSICATASAGFVRAGATP